MIWLLYDIFFYMQTTNNVTFQKSDWNYFLSIFPKYSKIYEHYNYFWIAYFKQFTIWTILRFKSAFFRNGKKASSSESQLDEH